MREKPLEEPSYALVWIGEILFQRTPLMMLDDKELWSGGNSAFNMLRSKLNTANVNECEKDVFTFSRTKTHRKAEVMHWWFIR